MNLFLNYFYIYSENLHKNSLIYLVKLINQLRKTAIFLIKENSWWNVCDGLYWISLNNAQLLNFKDHLKGNSKHLYLAVGHVFILVIVNDH